jgi:hypothetical protein
MRSIFVWIFFLVYTGPGNESFHFLQFLGYILIVYGTLVFNGVIEFDILDEARRFREKYFSQSNPENKMILL